MTRSWLCCRCGTCCRKGGPALHTEDLGLLDTLGLGALVCLRKGEPAYDPRVDAVCSLAQEVLKIRGKGDSWECLYYDSDLSGCKIYQERPLECRTLSCQETGPLFLAIDTPLVQRTNFVQPGSALWDCILEHEQQFPVSRAVHLAEQHRAWTQVSKELDAIFRAEIAYRLALAQYVQGRDEDLWPYLGRPLWLILAPYDRKFLAYGQDC